MRSSLARHVAGSLVALLAACAPVSSVDQGPLDRASVLSIVDGDTIDVEIGGVNERVRLLGIDTPESVSASTPVQCFGSEATEALLGLVPVGSELVIERDEQARDRYGRLLLYVYRSTDRLFVNEWMVAQGFADAVAYEPNTHHAGVFAAAMAQAEREGSGLWGRCDGPDQPLD